MTLNKYLTEILIFSTTIEQVNKWRDMAFTDRELSKQEFVTLIKSVAQRKKVLINQK
jgi:hypothetical protein